MKTLNGCSAVFWIVLLLASVGDAAPGYYGFSISASSTDPFVHSTTNPGPGVQSLYLWSTERCHPVEGGWSVLSCKIATPAATGWTVAGLVQRPGISVLNLSGDARGIDVFVVDLEEDRCSKGAKLLATITAIRDSGPGIVEFASPDASEAAEVGDCPDDFGLWAWPDFVRFRGFATPDAGAPQDEGNGCEPIPVNSNSWTRVKALYRTR